MYQRFCLIFGTFYNYVFLNSYGIDRVQVLISLTSFFIKREKNGRLLSPYTHCF